MKRILLLMLLATPAFAQIPVPLNQPYYCYVLTHSPENLILADATGLPTYEVLEDATAAAIVTGSVVARTSTSGEYYLTFNATLANGFELGKMYTTRVAATVESVSDKADCPPFRVVAADNPTGYMTGNTAYMSGTALTARDIGASVLLSSGTGTGQIKISAGYISPNFSDITGTLDASEIGTAAFTQPKFATNFLTSDGLDTTAANEIAAAVTIPTAATIANLVWDTTLASHLAAGSTGAALNSSASSGDPWATPVPASYVAGTAGYIVGNQVLRSITNNRPVLVSAAGGVAPDWANILAPTSTVDLSGTTVRLSNGTGAGQVKLSSGYISPNFSDINGTLDAAEFSSAFITNLSFAANAMNANALAADAASEIATAVGAPTAVVIAGQVWDTMDAGHAIAGTFGEDLNAAGTAGDPLNTMVPGSYSAGTMGYIIGNSLLRSSTINRPVDVNATGGVSIDWAAVDNPTTVLNLSGTTTKNATDIQALLPSALVGGKMDANVGSYTTGFGGFTLRKNVGVANYPFKLFLTGTSTAATGILAANLTCFISKDGGAGAALSDTTETEVDSTNFPGWYVVDISAAEMNAATIALRCKAPTTEPSEFQIVPEN